MSEQIQPDELQKNACVVNATTPTIGPERLRRLLNDHRNKLQETRRALLTSAAQLKDEIAAIEQLLAELTT